jgi:phage shock protein PspC (stress-responsive transcriptional regulator)
MTDNAENPHPESSESTAPPPLFVRPREGRLAGGVCAGIAERWKLDITLVRIVTVAAAIASGVGFIAYFAAWAMTPSVDGEAPLRPGTKAARLAGRLPVVVLIVLAAVMLTGLVHTLWWGAPVGILIAALLVALVVGTRRGRWTLLAVAALLVVGLTTVGVFGNHFGTRTYHVSSVDDLRSSYEYGAGKVNLDLSSMSFTGRHRTQVRLGRGDVVVTLPADAPVLVHARSGYGSVTIDGHEVRGIDAEQAQLLGGESSFDGGTSVVADRLVLDVVVGAGAVDVRVE